MTHPHSGGSGGSGGPGGNQWWLVTFQPASGVSSRLVQPSQPVYQVVLAPTEAAAKKKVKGDPGTPITVHGPFKTEADAHQAETEEKKKIAQGEQAGSFPNLNPLSGIEAGFQGFFNVLTDGKMWRSLGWLALGIILIAMGINLWLKLPEKFMSAAESSAKVAAL